MNLNANFKNRVRDEVIIRRKNYGGSDAKFAKTLGLNPSSFSKLKSNETDRVISDNEWLRIGQELNVHMKANNWKVVRTSVYSNIEDNLRHCKENSQSMILADSWGIGKSFSAKHIIKSMPNAFYLDCSQCKTKIQFIRSLAKIIGVDADGRVVEVKTRLKYYLNILELPIIVLDDSGDLEYAAFLELKEFWNGTEGSCAWYLIGDDSLEAKIRKGISNKKVGYGAIFSRFNNEYIKLIPTPKEDKTHYYRNLLTSVASANVSDKSKINKMVNMCLNKETALRYLTTLIKMNK